MPPASADRQVDVVFEPEEARVPEPPPGEQRFRVVSRRRRAINRPFGLNSLHRTLLLSAFPALCLLAYVVFWTLAMRGGYYRDQLRHQIREVRIEQAELEAQKRGLQSAGPVLERAARELGMKQAGQRDFAQLPPSTTARARP